MKRLFFFCIAVFSCVFSYSQELILNEICAKNIFCDTSADNASPDWIEIKNVSNTVVRLSDYSIATKDILQSPWTLPAQTLQAGEILLLEANAEQIVVKQWETVIDFGALFKYVVPTAEITNWQTPDFDDSQWTEGATPIGYGESDIASSVESGSRVVYMRKTFTISSLENVVQLMLNVDCDDGFIAYINGKEIARSNVSSSAFDAYAQNAAEEVIRDGGIPTSYSIDVSDCDLKEGENTFALQLHNCNATSSDLVGTPILTIGYSNEESSRQGVSKYVSVSTQSETFPFTLDASSDVLYLLKSSVIVDSLSWKDMPADVSLGRVSGDNTSAYYFSTPTPNAENTTEAFVAKTLEKPKLTVPANVFVYADFFYVSAYSSDSKVVLRYTTNGSAPTNTSTVFPDSLEISKTTNLRVAAFRDGYLPSETTTATYLFLDREQTLPIASITVKYIDFFGYNSGIYVEGPNASSEEPHYGANYWQDWEKQVHFEYFMPDDGLVLSQDVGVKIGGNYSREMAQKTLKLYARKQYGRDNLNFQFFEDKPISAFHIILLRNSGNDFNNTQMRDGAISELAKSMNIDRQAYQPAVVYINGEYYGIQNVREKMNEHYVAENYGYDKDDIDYVVKNGELGSGNLTDYLEMRNFIENNDLSDSANYEKAKTLLDIPSFIDYNILEMYVVNEDWPGNNIAYWHNRKLNTPWRYMLFDADFGLGIWDVSSKVKKNTFERSTLENSSDYSTAPWSTIVLRQLLKSADFKRDFLNTLADRLNTNLSTYSARRTLDSVHTLISAEMPYHKKRWGENWQDSYYNQMLQFVQQREDIMRTQAEEFFSTNGSYKLTLQISEKNAGKIHLNVIDITSATWSGKYFNNNTITMTAIPNPGYEFAHWEGAINSTEPTISLTTDQATTLTAVFNYVGNEPQLEITEVYYHNYTDADTKWVEIHNKGDFSVDLSNYTINVDRYNQAFTIPSGIIIQPNEYLVFTNDSTKLRSRYSTIAIVGNMNIDFPKDFAKITLRNENDYVIAKFSYSDDYLHARKSDGYGYSFEYDPSYGKYYSVVEGGTPGSGFDESNHRMIGPESPIISEINYASGKLVDAGDWIELYNPNAFEMSLANWMITDNGGNISVIREGVYLPANSYIVFADNVEKFHAVYPDVTCFQLDLSLNNYVDGVNLFNQDEDLEDAVSYSMFESQWTKSAYATGRTLSLRNVSVESDNSKGINWSASKSFGTPGAPNDYILAINPIETFVAQIYPTECSDYVTISCEGEYSYDIVSLTGIVELSGNASNTQTISLSNLPIGIHLVVIQQNDARVFRKIVKK